VEIEIGNYIRSLGLIIETNVRTILNGLELDIYIPEKRIAIEYNGIYWHSAFKKKPNYHVDKYLQCKEVGIHLIQIFEDEWMRNSSLIKARLKNVLGFGQKIAARKCTIVELTTGEYRDFVDRHHLSGYAHSTLKYGLQFKGEIKAVMGFSKSRYTKDGYEIIRYCSDETVVGGAGKLLAHFVSAAKPNNIVTYADRCWSNGNLYRKLGFVDTTIHSANTSYWYIKNNIRYHRSNFTKGRLVKLGYSPLLTETEIMDQLGYTKIYDCGNYRFEWTSPS